MHKKNGNIIASILVALLCAGWAIVNSRTATTNKPPHFYGEAVGTTCSFECLSALRPAAAGEREVLAGEKSAVGGEFIASVEEVPCLGQAFEYFETNAPATFTSFRRLIYDEARGRYRIKWARGLGFPFQVRRNGEEYELLVDASLRSDRLQRVKIGGFGLEDAFALHQILSFGMAVRHAFLIDQGFCADAAAIDIETAKVISARAWLIKHERFDGAWKAVFCGDAARKGLAPLLDELCGEECPGKYTILYQELFRDDNGSADDVSIRGTSEGERKTARIAQAVVRIESSVGGTVDSQEALRLFDVINPIDGKELARKICDGRVSSEAQRNAWPDRWLYQEEEMALFKEREREMTLFELGMTIVGDHDVGNAIYYMHINAGIAAVIKKYPWMREGGRSHRALHYASRCMVYPISRFDRTRGGRFISFYTAWINKPRAAEMREEISDRQRILEALFTWGAKVEAKRIPDEHITDLADYRNVGPVAALLSGAKIGEARRMIAVLPARLRTVMKLVSGIRLGMPNVTPMKLEQVGEILGITFQRVEQLQKVALTRLEEETGQKPDREVPLDDGDLYLIARVGLSFDSPLFEELCARGEAWIEDHAAGLTAALCGVQPLPRPVITDDAAAWLSLSRELNRSRRDRDTAARSMARRRLYDDVAGDMQRYNALCALVSRFIREPGMDREAQRALTERICALGPVRAPVEKKRRWEAKSQRKRRIKRGGGRGFGESSVWISTPGSPEWVVRDVDLPEEVVVIPSMADGRLQVRIADGRSRFAPTYYEGSWHPESGTATTRAQEVAAYLAGTTGVQESPDGLISQRAVLGGTSAWLEVPMNGKVVPLYIDPALAIVPGEDGTPARRVFWRSRFQDVRGRGVRIALTPNGVPVGTAYVSGEELVPVPGPVLRSQRSYLGDAESGLILASRLRALECVKDAILV
ncbi:MAG: sigma factor-like helix-turn-helix DNA-binding protein, partial [Candidatus Omnitrophota bacterium]